GPAAAAGGGGDERREEETEEEALAGHVVLLEVDREAARVLLAVGGLVGGEERIVAEVEAQDDALAEDEQGAAAGVEGGLGEGGLGDGVDLGEGGGAAAAEGEEGEKGALGPHEDHGVEAVDDQRAVG